MELTKDELEIVGIALVEHHTELCEQIAAKQRKLTGELSDYITDEIKTEVQNLIELAGQTRRLHTAIKKEAENA